MTVQPEVVSQALLMVRSVVGGAGVMGAGFSNVRGAPSLISVSLTEPVPLSSSAFGAVLLQVCVVWGSALQSS